MKHFILPEDFKGEELTINNGKDFHYLSHVLRLREGDTLNCIDKNGNPYRLIILAVNDKHIRLKPLKNTSSAAVQNFINANRPPMPRINLYQCMPKGKKMDIIIRQATEMGVSSITPVISRYTVPMLETDAKIKIKLKRWERIAKEAAQQSGAQKIPQINTPVFLQDIKDVKSEKPAEIFIFFHPDPETGTDLHKILSDKPDSVGILIGPEGGFSAEEVNSLKRKGLYAAYLGGTILRAETAAVYSTAAVKIILFEKNSWKIHNDLETEYETS